MLGKYFEYRNSRQFVWRLIAVALMLFCLFKAFLYKYWLASSIYTMDDSFISFRYAEHLAQSGRIAWNIGEHSLTEGYTSLVWVVIMAMGRLAGLDLLPFSKILGVSFVLLSAGMLGMTAMALRNGSAKWIAALLILIIFLSNGHLVLHMVSGMETALAILLTSAYGILMLLLGRHWGNVQRLARFKQICVAAAILASLGALNRPEFVVFVVVTLLVSWVQFPNSRRDIMRFFALPIVLFGGAYVVIRLNVYGLDLPLPFYIKVGAHRRFAGAEDVGRFAREVWPCLAWMLAGLALRSFRNGGLAVVAAVFALIGFFILPEHIMGMGFRFLMPLYGLISLLSVISMLEFWRLASSWKGHVLWFATVLWTVQFVISHTAAHEVEGLVWYGNGMTQAHIKLGQAMAKMGPDHVVAVGDAGAIPYYSKWRAIDTFGLNDRTIAFSRFNGRYDTEYVLRQKPDLLVFISRACSRFDPPLPHEALLKKDAEVSGYRFLGVARFADTYNLHLYAKDAAAAAGMTKVFSQQHVFATCTDAD